MHVTIDHRTTYRYERPASGIIQLFRLTPRADDAQQVLAWRIDVDADGRLVPFRDTHGNIAHAFYADAPAQQITIRVSGDLITTDTAGIVTGVDEPLQPVTYRRDTPLTIASPAIAAIAQKARDPNPVVAAHALMNAVADAIAFDTATTNSLTDAATAFAQGSGVCQDMAHIIVAAARHIGFPARYVSGHYAAPDHPEQEAAHAWAELYIADLGWVGFDAAHRICATPGHIRVAIGFDALDAAPIRGSRRGGGAESLAVEVRGHESRRAGLLQVQGQQQG